MNTEIKIVISGSFRKHLNDIGIAVTNFEKANTKVLAPLTKEAINSNDSFVFLTTDEPEKSADILEKEFMANVGKAELNLANFTPADLSTDKTTLLQSLVERRETAKKFKIC